MREIIIVRKKRFSASLASPTIILDGDGAARVKNGETLRLTVDDEAHEIYSYFNNKNGNKLHIAPGDENVILNIDFVYNEFRLSSAEDYGEQARVTSIIAPPAEPKKQTASYICGIVISILLLGFSYYIYSIEEASTLGFALGAIFSIASGVLMIIGGFWFIVIPLPYIAIWKAGCLKPNQPMLRKVLLGIFTFVCVVMVFVSLFAIK